MNSDPIPSLSDATSSPSRQMLCTRRLPSNCRQLLRLLSGADESSNAFLQVAEGEGLEPPHRLITGSAVFKTARLPITVALLFQRSAHGSCSGAR